MLRIFSLFALITMVFSCLPGNTMATPKERYDEVTQTCRFLDFYNSGWVSEGSKIFTQSCKNCHFQGNDKGAPFLYSESKTMKGWNRVFATRYPACAASGAWDGISKEDLIKVNDYLFRNAANTYDANDADDCG
ncbi:MAG: cytochrome c [Proteobacteria bacterium]|nr:cytochrome c [Pseudomonadota bacterium]MBU1737991.1 cytochrome c [Pseudomonadota bacterium]